jgi:hypothetical protein
MSGNASCSCCRCIQRESRGDLVDLNSARSDEEDGSLAIVAVKVETMMSEYRSGFVE